MFKPLKDTNIEDLEECPYCGNDQYATKERIYGIIFHNQTFKENEEAENGEMYETSSTTLASKYYYCEQCFKKIAKIPEDKQY